MQTSYIQFDKRKIRGKTMKTIKDNGKFSLGIEKIKADDGTEHEYFVLMKEKYQWLELASGGKGRVDQSQKIFMSEEELEIVKGLLKK